MNEYVVFGGWFIMDYIFGPTKSQPKYLDGPSGRTIGYPIEIKIYKFLNSFLAKQDFPPWKYQKVSSGFLLRFSLLASLRHFTWDFCTCDLQFELCPTKLNRLNRVSTLSCYCTLLTVLDFVHNPQIGIAFTSPKYCVRLWRLMFQFLFESQEIREERLLDGDFGA